MTVYSVRMVSGAEFMWTGDVADFGNGRAFVILAGGTVLNVAHVESLTPVGTVEAEAEAG